MKSLILLLMLTLSTFSQADVLFGKVHDIFGNAYISDTTTNNLPLHVGKAIYVGQTVHTEDNAELHIVSKDGGLIALRPNTIFRVDEYYAEDSPSDKVYMSLLKGSMRSIAGWIPKHHPQAYEVHALTATIGIRGTDHEITIIHDGDEAGIHSAVYHGATVLRNQSGEVHVTAGQFAHVAHDGNSAPRLLNMMPKFHANKVFYKIEHRFEQHKLFLENELERIHEEWQREWHELHVELASWF